MMRLEVPGRKRESHGAATRRGKGLVLRPAPRYDPWAVEFYGYRPEGAPKRWDTITAENLPQGP
jgi:hypothetical protein